MLKSGWLDCYFSSDPAHGGKAVVVVVRSIKRLPAGYEHVSLRTLPGMEDRCIRIGSAGKTFSFTAWKVGWITGPRPMVAAAAKAHQFLTFTVPSAFQYAVAAGLEQERSFYEG